MSGTVPVLVAASGAAWETAALERLRAAAPGVVLLKRCVDLSDLLASAGTGQARAALVSDALPGLDADSVAVLGRAGVGVVMVCPSDALGGGARGRAERLGIRQVLVDTELSALAGALRSAGVDAAPVSASREATPVAADRRDGHHAGRVIAVWGPAGAPGRTTVAVTVAAELARRGRAAFLLDADPYGGTVAQHLGVLDEVSGLLAAVRLANAGRLDEDRLVALARQVGPGLRLLTGLPRADRWSEVRGAAFTALLRAASALDQFLVLDTGFSLETDPDALDAPLLRNGTTLAALATADEVLVVGSADPVGVARLARALVELRGHEVAATVRVLVNRCRASLGWKEADLRSLVGDFAATAASVHLLPDDRGAVDRALVVGKSLVELGDSPLRRGLAEVVDALTGETRSRRRSLLRQGQGRRRSR